MPPPSHFPLFWGGGCRANAKVACNRPGRGADSSTSLMQAPSFFLLLTYHHHLDVFCKHRATVIPWVLLIYLLGGAFALLGHRLETASWSAMGFASTPSNTQVMLRPSSHDHFARCTRPVLRKLHPDVSFSFSSSRPFQSPVMFSLF